MPNSILRTKRTKRSTLKPSVNYLEYGELCINFHDRKIFYKTSLDNIKEFSPLSYVSSSYTAYSGIVGTSIYPIVSDTNVDLVLSKKANGSLLAQIPDGTITNGNKRGESSIDLQSVRTAPDQVAQGKYNIILGGYSNKNVAAAATTEQENYIISGDSNIISSPRGGIVTGSINTLNISANSSSIVTGGNNFINTATFSSNITGNDNTINSGSANIIISGDATEFISFSNGFGTATPYSSSIVSGKNCSMDGAHYSLANGNGAKTKARWQGNIRSITAYKQHGEYVGRSLLSSGEIGSISYSTGSIVDNSGLNFSEYEVLSYQIKSILYNSTLGKCRSFIHEGILEFSNGIVLNKSYLKHSSGDVGTDSWVLTPNGVSYSSIRNYFMMTASNLESFNNFVVMSSFSLLEDQLV